MNRIGNYQLVASIGRGGMAEVFLALSSGMQGFQKLLVLKTLKPELAADPEFIDMFLAEARVAALLNHPNVVQTYEVGRDGDRPFIAMEYLEGQPFSAILARVGRAEFPIELYVHILTELLGGLHAAHEATDLNGAPLEVVHRDISPHNVFVMYSGQVKLLDFGIAKVASSGALTKYGVIKGKVGYMAPEQAMGLPVDRRADIFAAGVMLWEALMRKRLVPPTEDDTLALKRRLAGDDPPAAASNDVETLLVGICHRAMERSPTSRFETAAEMREALEAWLARPARARERELSRLVETAFEKERSQIRKLVEAQVAGSEANGEISLVEIATSLAGATSEPRLQVAGDAAAPTVAPPSVTERHERRSRTLGIALGAALVVGAAVFVVVHRTSPPTVDAAPASGPLSSAADTPSAASPDLVRLRVTASPADAAIEVDGKVVAGPYDARLPKDGHTIRIRVSAAGFEPEEKTVALDSDLMLDISLRRVAAAPVATDAAVVEQGIKKPPTRRPTVPTTAKTSAGAIDEKDPYAR